jgi:ring-1,2-phenylacetyl-CoA epoxidase subunit PaaD
MANDKQSINEPQIWEWLSAICDPEIPVLSIVDLGIIRKINIEPSNDIDQANVEIIITPTYSGCPAMNTIEAEIAYTLTQQGLSFVKITTVLSPAWTTDWLSAAGRAKLLAYGIAPPTKTSSNKQALFAAPPVVACPQCGSTKTQMISNFGSTPCKALYRCLNWA